MVFQKPYARMQLEKLLGLKTVIPAKAGIQSLYYKPVRTLQDRNLSAHSSPLGLRHQLLPSRLQFTLTRINHRLIVKRRIG